MAASRIEGASFADGTDASDSAHAADIAQHGAAAVGRSRPWFVGELQSRGIRVHADSGLGRGLAALEDLEARYRAQELQRIHGAEAIGDLQRFWLLATGVDFLSKALHVGSVSGLSGFDDAWRLLKSANPVLTGPSDGVHAQARTKTWEHLLASLASTFSRVRQGEPDLICDWGDLAIGLAAKVMFQRKRSVFEKLAKKGIAQIQDSAIDAGCVVINLVEQFPHKELFLEINRARIADPSAVCRIVSGWVDAFVAGYAYGWERLFKKKDKLMGIALFVPTALPLAGSSKYPPMAYHRLHLITSIEREHQTMPFMRQLQTAFEDVFGFEAPGRGASVVVGGSSV